MLASRANYVAVGCELKWDYGVTPSRLRYSGFPGKSGFGHRNSIRKGSAKATCNSKAKMSAQSKVGMSVFYLLVVRLEATDPMSVVLMSKRELMMYWRGSMDVG